MSNVSMLLLSCSFLSTCVLRTFPIARQLCQNLNLHQGSTSLLSELPTHPLSRPCSLDVQGCGQCGGTGCGSIDMGYVTPTLQEAPSSNAKSSMSVKTA